MENFNEPITYISDCRDDNTTGRLRARVSTYFPGSNVIFVGVKNDVEAAINLVDIVDAYEGRPGVVLLNVAPRHGEAQKKWPNGTPFGWVKLDNIDLFTTIDGLSLSLLQKVRGKNIDVKVYDIPKTVPQMDLTPEVQERIIHTQFRSFDYLPRLAAAIMMGKELEVTEMFSGVPEMKPMICWVDSFGNMKTNVLPEEIGFEVGREVVFRVSGHKQFRLPCYERLKDIPNDYVALTVGSSGMHQNRFVEIMQQGGSASESLGVGSGTDLEIVGRV
ncbi:MAG: hypothetical protein COW24_04775 [Candidatus Kerfeldbacteria bacterium CG15_BIG_FIL_POST_REV_8_21_14_020_45_12]|uniref:S-adenosyl-l-methionine hydroxide adenosyltransferase C-terminal domain-containing protein n=1 Tax=Candidatus Kerfeldbacteria bacterium CG15_BIG_FIL_POST_REV_8_21_14_020_45_12 TaxID=2014247 RepID=A0A2M7H2N0_9BACT|nr:MAG: hypothetical protein COW24_04775 [Candidatus Kerfeldbacteria bacterium CG15_BIG_FIL_POST_REV_8_21_14_020_45_12]PJA93269.1 MAG: hypothetical protein CO132_04145 [Candidatus Kerfeldbacteria bacterium CG_4_9_14_3_um_filter_45_8]